MNETQVLVSPKWKEELGFKLYVSPVNSFTKESLKEYFSQYADIADIYMSEADQYGFKWAFVYFTTEKGLLEAVSCIEKDNAHNFKLSRAKSKKFLQSDAKYTPKMKIMNGDVSLAGRLLVPNCANCKKLTFLQCSSCRNPFCSKECTLDGWRSHTGPCVKIADLIRDDRSGEYDYSNTTTVVTFMKDVKQTKKNFAAKEFADACISGQSMANASFSIPEQLEGDRGEEYVNNVPKLDKHPHPGKEFSTSFYKKVSISDKDETDKSATEAQKKFQKRVNEPYRQPYKNNNSQKFHNRGSNMNSEDHQNASNNTNRKPNRKTFTDIEDTEENEQNRCKSFSKSSQSKHRASETKEPNRNRADFDKHNTTKKNSFKGSGRNYDNEPKVTNITPPLLQTDLKLEEGAAATVVVTSITNLNTFFIANHDKVVNMLQQIIDCAHGAPKLSSADVNTLCLAYFQGDYYRARVVNTAPFIVEYIDYGNTEESSIDSLKELPEALKNTLPLATKVQLKEGDVKVKNIEENKTIYIFVDKYKAKEDCYIVDVL